MDNVIQKLVKKFGTNDPFEIAKGLNIIIVYKNMGKTTRGIYFRKLRRRFIVINSELSEEWQKVVCAHELGHDRLHPGLGRFWLDENTFFNTGKYERQANTFAVKLLTYTTNQYIDEPLDRFLLRCGVPHEIHKLFL
ncbi:ImmA/IrrE family metallo-endopeptidase [Paenibacillus xylanexedens]|uniref:ImmA/IrrE family metallo-endopeptidase n=1 Tax=Paenibacillus xylanexedens TaxID=528191 RepID=UPI000F547561|nr:ImmA/IrrE family metallo-endopeptidase [Paenibacillus xylanexedens]